MQLLTISLSHTNAPLALRERGAFSSGRIPCALADPQARLSGPQPLGRRKRAAHQAREAGALGPHLNQLFQRSFAVAKEVRSQTEIGSAHVSMAVAAVRLAQHMFGD